MMLSDDDKAAVDRILWEVVQRRDIAADMDDKVQWRRYANAETVLVELRDEIEEFPQ